MAATERDGTLMMAGSFSGAALYQSDPLCELLMEQKVQIQLKERV
jgi:hypothetical protein